VEGVGGGDVVARVALPEAEQVEVGGSDAREATARGGGDQRKGSRADDESRTRAAAAKRRVKVARPGVKSRCALPGADGGVKADGTDREVPAPEPVHAQTALESLTAVRTYTRRVLGSRSDGVGTIPEFGWVSASFGGAGGPVGRSQALPGPQIALPAGSRPQGMPRTRIVEDFNDRRNRDFSGVACAWVRCRRMGLDACSRAERGGLAGRSSTGPALCARGRVLGAPVRGAARGTAPVRHGA
jgi:hypothetical protein